MGVCVGRMGLAVVLLAAGCRGPSPQVVDAPVIEPDALSVTAAEESAAPPRAARKKALRFRAQPISGSLPGWTDRDVERTTLRLRGGLFSPMPGGYVAGYPQDTGLDIGGFRLPVYAVAAGTLDYSEAGHTRWAGDDDKAVRLELDEPIPYEGRRITHIWYAHLHELTHLQPEGAARRIRVMGGERLGTSGIANGSPHLHLGFLLDGSVRQRWGTYLLDDEIRVLLGNYRMKERLPTVRKNWRRGR